MDDHTDTLHIPLQQAEGFCDLGMWQQAWDALDGLRDELKAHPAVLSSRLDVLVGMKHWEKALILGKSLARVLPNDEKLWFRLACIHAQLGDMEAAKGAIAKCIDIDPGWRIRVVDEALLVGVW